MTTLDIQQASIKWLDKADIPNLHGFKFIALLKDGSQQGCMVIRLENGLHTVEGGIWSRILGWREVI